MPETRPTAARYGALNLDYVATWGDKPADEPMWALNLMHYREVADYRDGRDSSISGREADDRYAPFGPLAQVGARIVFVADVVEQLAGHDVSWDRVALVRYPSRHAIAELELLPSFAELHVHKEAGMARTIVAATFPRADSVDVAGSGDAADRLLLLQVIAGPSDPAIHVADARFSATFEIEGVIIGDGREWARAQWDEVSSADLATLRSAMAAMPVRDERYVVVLRPMIDDLAESLGVTGSR
jgi:hypothetical protein